MFYNLWRFEFLRKIFYSVELIDNKTVDIIINSENNYLKISVYDFSNEETDIVFNKSYKDIFKGISLCIFIIVNIIACCYYIISSIKHGKNIFDYEKKMKKEMEYNYKNSIELPEYNPIIARTILYKKYISIETMIPTIKKYFKNINALDENNQIIESNLCELDEVEKLILEESQKKYLERNYYKIEEIVYDKLKDLKMI